MPDKIIEIPSVGRIAFPDSMSDSDIEAAAAKLYKQANPDHPPVAPSHSWLSQAVDWLPTAGGAVGGIAGGLTGAVPGAIGGAALGGAAGEGLRQLAQRAMGNAAPATMTDAATQMGGQAALQGGAEALGAGVTKAASLAGPALMTSALKPAYALTAKATKAVELPRVVQTLLDEGVNVTKGGIGKINDLLSATNDQISNIIRNSTSSVFPEKVADAAQGVIARAGNQVAPAADQAAASGVVDEFLRGKGGATPTFPGKPLSVQEAQTLKQGTYQAIGQRAYGEVKGAATEAEKALARGLKEGIQDAHPEVQGLNAREGSLIEARDAIAKRVALAANRDPAGLGWIAENPKSFMAFVLARSPAVKSMLARGLYQSASRASQIPENLIRVGVKALATSPEDSQ